MIRNVRMIAAMLLAAGVACGHPPVGSPPPSVHAARRYELFAPSNRPGMPLVIVLHPGEHTGHEVREITGFDRVAAREEFVVVYPDGIDRHWNDGRPEIATGADDVGFIAWLIDELAVTRHIDRTRVYVTGLSNGAMMAYRLGCQLADRIAAIAPVAGVMGIEECSPARPVPVLHFHGTADALVPFDGGGVTGFPSVEDTVSGWGERDGCTGERQVSFEQGDALCTRWDACDQGTAVELCVIDAGGHTWPGGRVPAVAGKTSQDLVATDRMWEFFKEHPLPAR